MLIFKGALGHRTLPLCASVFASERSFPGNKGLEWSWEGRPAVCGTKDHPSQFSGYGSQGAGATETWLKILALAVQLQALTSLLALVSCSVRWRF